MSLFWSRNSGYGIMLDEYNNNYSLVAGNESEKDGIQYKDWVFLSKWQKGQSVPDTKKRPMGVYFGEKEKAIEALEFFLKALKAKPQEALSENVPEDDIPF